MFLGSHSGACPVGQDERVVTCVHCDDVTQGSHCPESFGLPRTSLPKPLVPAGPSLSPRLCLFQKVPSGEHTGYSLFRLASFFVPMFYFLERGEGREKERERNIDMREERGLVASYEHPDRGQSTEPETLAGPPTWNRTGDVSVCGRRPTH